MRTRAIHPSRQVRLERRQAVRLEVTAPVVTRLLAISEPVSLKNIGPGGCLVESPGPLVLGSQHELTMETPDGWSATVGGAVAHCRRVTAPGASPKYAIGFTFVPSSSQRTAQAVDRLIERLVDALSAG